MNFKKQPFGFMDMLRFKKMVPTRRKMLAEGPDTPLPQEYRTNTLAKKLHPGYMQVELTAARPLTDSIRELTGFEKVTAVSNNVFYPRWLEGGMELCLETLNHLLSALPVYELSCRPDEEAVRLTEEAVFGGSV